MTFPTDVSVPLLKNIRRDAPKAQCTMRATGVSTNPTLTWSATGATSYDVSFGTTNPPPQVVSGISSASYTPAIVANGTTYFWQVIARNASGSTTGPVWSFTTASTPPA